MSAQPLKIIQSLYEKEQEMLEQARRAPDPISSGHFAVAASNYALANQMMLTRQGEQQRLSMKMGGIG